MKSYAPLIEWIGPSDTPSGRTGRKFRVSDAEHVRTLFNQLQSPHLARLIELAAAELRRRVESRV